MSSFKIILQLQTFAYPDGLIRFDKAMESFEHNKLSGYTILPDSDFKEGVRAHILMIYR